jgi:hypothetical protein
LHSPRARPCAFCRSWEARGRGFKGDFLAEIVLPVFRASAVAFANADYPAHDARDYARTAGDAASAVEFYHLPGRAQPILTNSTTAAARASTHAARSAFPAYGVAHASDCVEDAAYAYTTAVRGAAVVAHVTFWSAVSIDTTRVDKGVTASDITGSPLWSQDQPEPLRALWQDLKVALLGANQDWHVWTRWYDDRLDGRVRDEARELAYVRIEEALWDQGPAVVNAEIKRRIEEPPQPSVVELQAHSSSGAHGSAGVVSTGGEEQAITAVPVDNPPIEGGAGQPRSEILAAWQSADAALQTPHPGRQYVPDVLFNPVALADRPPVPIEAIPEQQPLATRFCVNSEGLIDVVPDPPAPGTAADPLQREFYEEIRLKAQSLVAVGPNQLGDLSGPANRFCDGLKDRIEDISITSLVTRQYFAHPPERP